MSSPAAVAATRPPLADKPGAGSAPAQFNWDLCGIGPVPIRPPTQGSGPPSSDLLPGPLGHLARVEAWPNVLAAMEVDPSERSRAAALVLRASGVLDAETTQAQPVAPTDTTPQVRQLAALAATTRDAAVLRWALAVCERVSSAGVAECKTLSPQQLVALEPDDARHWLALAAANPQRQNEALQRAADAPTISAITPLWPAVQAALPATLPSYLAQDLLLHALAVSYSLMDQSAGVALRACRPQGTASKSTCLALADALYARGPDLMTQAVGAGLGAQLGWSAERVAAARAETQRLMGHFDQIHPAQPYSCDAVQQNTRLLRDLAEHGEVGTLRRRAAAAASASAAAPTAAGAAR